MSDTLVRGEAVKLSSFGNSTVRSKDERVGRNPRTGVEVSIEKRRVMVFKPSEVLKAHVNLGGSQGLCERWHHRRRRLTGHVGYPFGLRQSLYGAV
jgi:hypothetical protein